MNPEHASAVGQDDPTLRLLQEVLARIDGWVNPYNRPDQAVVFEEVRRKAAGEVAAAGLGWIGRAA